MQVIKDQQVQKYLPYAMNIILKKPIPNKSSLNQNQRVLITKICNNVSLLCKMSKKEAVDFLKAAPSYQPALAELFFQQTINNWRIIVNEPPIQKSAVTVLDSVQGEGDCIGVDYRVEFTLASIGNLGKKKGIKALIMMTFFMENGSQHRYYFSLDQFEKLRYQVADVMKSIVAIQMKTLL